MTSTKTFAKPRHDSRRLPAGVRALALAAAALTFSACGADRLTPLGFQALKERPALFSSGVTFRTLDPQISNGATCLLFMLDISGSNVSSPGTDPDRSRRFDSLMRFLDEEIAAGGQDTYYSLMTFSSAAQSRMPAGTAPFVNDPNQFKQIVEATKNGTADGGGTNYAGAINAMQAQILANVSHQQAQPDPVACYYVNFHISDGYPNDAMPGILQAVDNLLNVALGQPLVSGIILNTGYYYTVFDAAAKEAMRLVAERGRGEALEFGPGQDVDFKKFKIPRREIAISYNDFLVLNENTVWESCKLRKDSDGDGLSDLYESSVGSNAFGKDSDINGIADLVESRLRGGRPCLDGACVPARAERYPECEAHKLPIAEQNPATGLYYEDTDEDGLNDCEEQLIGTRDDRWDSNGDWIPDWLGFRLKVAVIPTQRDESLDPDLDFRSNYQEVKEGTPIDCRNEDILDFRPYRYFLTLTRTTPAFNEYAVDIRDIPVIGAGNRLRLFLSEKTLGVKDSRFLRQAVKPFDANGAISFSAADFGAPSTFSCTNNDPCNR